MKGHSADRWRRGAFCGQSVAGYSGRFLLGEKYKNLALPTLGWERSGIGGAVLSTRKKQEEKEKEPRNGVSHFL